MPQDRLDERIGLAVLPPWLGGHSTPLPVLSICCTPLWIQWDTKRMSGE